MDHFVNVERLPDGLRFPADLAERIHYEPEAHRLVQHGFKHGCVAVGSAAHAHDPAAARH